MQNYEMQKKIGEGTYGVVYQAMEKETREIVAIKQFKSNSDPQLCQRELRICSMLNHPNIVALRDSFRVNDLLHLVFDFYQNDLSKLLRRYPKGIPTSLACSIAYQIGKAVECCHKYQIIHRDIKPENILLDKKQNVKLCDLGVARILDLPNQPLTDYVSTRWYRPPEQELRSSRYSFSADIWSIGCIIMELHTGEPVFAGQTQIDQINRIQELLGPIPELLTLDLVKHNINRKEASTSLAEAYGTRVPASALEIVTWMLTLEAKDRPSIRQCLRHSYFQEYRNKEKDQERERQRKPSNAEGMDEGMDEKIEEEALAKEMEERKTTTEANLPTEGQVVEEIEENIEGVSSHAVLSHRTKPSDHYDDDFE